MSHSAADRLYNLLPAIYRLRDAAEGQPLAALLAVIEGEFALVEQDMLQLLDDFAIETCQESIVPYIGDLLAVRGLHPIRSAGFTQRAYVANTVAYRRRKGTAAILEQLARDVTGWPAAAVEYFERLVMTQHVNHVRLHAPAAPDLRPAVGLRFPGGAFDRLAHTADVRHIDNGRGKHNIPHVGLFLWRVQAYHVTRGSARAAAPGDQRRFTFNPLGLSRPLFNLPATETSITHLAGPLDVPQPLGRPFLGDNLAALYGSTDAAASLLIHEAGAALPGGRIRVCDLSDVGGGWAHTPAAGEVGVDPGLGRLAFGSDPAGTVEVSYAYGFPGDLGGGPYQRRDAVKAFLAGFHESTQQWQIGVSQEPPPGAGAFVVKTLGEAVQEWNNRPAGTTGIIAVMDSRTYRENLSGGLAIRVPPGSRLLLVAADWPEEPGQTGKRLGGRLAPAGLRPHLAGNLEVIGDAPAGSPDAGGFEVNGLLLEGNLTVLEGNLGNLALAHCTLAPAGSALTIQAGAGADKGNSGLALALERTICGPLALPATLRAARLVDTIVDGDLSAPALDVEACTVLGQAQADTLHATNSLFTGAVTVERQQEGCVRFCYLPFASQTPRRHRCQPADAAAGSDIVPRFVSVTYGDPGYAQLSRQCPPEIGEGADDEGEMGAFHFLQGPQRLANLGVALEEYLRFGLEAGVFFAS